MSEPFLAEIRMVGFNFAPRGWAFCDGQILPINQNQSLYALLGTTYGGDGRTNFALPDLRGRTPIREGQDAGASHPLGQKGGLQNVTLTEAETPAHTHALKASSTAGDGRIAAGGILAGAAVYRPHSDTRLTALRSGSITNTGGSQSHNNMQPYTTLSFTIALQGLFPSRN